MALFKLPIPVEDFDKDAQERIKDPQQLKIWQDIRSLCHMLFQEGLRSEFPDVKPFPTDKPDPENMKCTGSAVVIRFTDVPTTPKEDLNEKIKWILGWPKQETPYGPSIVKNHKLFYVCSAFNIHLGADGLLGIFSVMWWYKENKDLSEMMENQLVISDNNTTM